MKFKQTISPELKDIIKSCTKVEQRRRVATKHQISIHTLNSLIEGKRNINDNNKACIVELVTKAIKNAKEMNFSLMDYYQSIRML